MVWGAAAARGVDDLVERVRQNDVKLSSLHIMKQRKFGEQEATKLFTALKTNTTLTELYCSGHAMTTATANELAGVLAVNNTLQSLCIGDSTFGDAEVEALLPGLLASASLQRLDLENKAVGVAGAAALGHAVGGGSKLSHLVLARNSRLGDAGASALSSANSWSWIRSLDLTACSITAKGLEALSCTPMPQLTTLLLANNPLGTAGGEAAVKLLASAPQLKTLVLSHTELADEGVCAVARGLVGSGVEELDVSHCGAAEASGSAFAAALSGENPCALRQLQLGGSDKLTGRAVAEIASAMAPKDGTGTTTCPLRVLDISRAQVDAVALTALAAAPKLQSLTLLGCSSLGRVDPEDLCSTLCAPSSFPALEDLNLAGCDLNLAAVRLLLQRLQEQATVPLPALQVLAIGANEATEHEELEQLIQSCQEAREKLHIHWRSGDGLQDDRQQ